MQTYLTFSKKKNSGSDETNNINPSFPMSNNSERLHIENTELKLHFSSSNNNVVSCDGKNKKFESNRSLYVMPSFLCPELFSNNNNILIDENGLKTAPEEKRGKFTYFGIDPNAENEDHQCDIVVNLDSSLQKEYNKKVPLFYIAFDSKLNYFFVKSLTKEVYFSAILTPFKQITLEVNKKTYFKIGKIITVINVKKDDHTIQIKLKKSDIIKEEQIYNFTDDKCPINIGRINCDVIIKNESISKSHVTIDYDKIEDKYFLVDNGSTNGTQLLLHEGKIIPIEGNMTFNLGNKQFKIEERK